MTTKINYLLWHLPIHVKISHIQKPKSLLDGGMTPKFESPSTKRERFNRINSELSEWCR